MRIGIRFFSLVLPAVLALGWGVTSAAQTTPAEEQKPQPDQKVAAPEVPAEMQQKAKTYKGSPAPPKPLQQLPDGHWTPYNPPANAQGAEWYVIVKGDTLSQLAQQKLGTWLLWPQIWDQNTYIQDAHWIYPGDPLLIAKPQVVSEATPVEEPVVPPPAPVQGGMTIEEEALQPPINSNDVYCSGFVTKSFQRPHLTILAGQRAETVGWAKGDVVYLNEGKKDGVEPGNEYQVLRMYQKVYHPVSGREIGTFVQRTGKVKVLAVQDHTCIAEITESCDEIFKGNVLVPWRPIPIPWDVKRSEGMPLQLEDTSKTKGRVIYSNDRLTTTGVSNIIYIDLGSKSQLVPGDKVWIYRFPAAEGTQGTMLDAVSDLYRQQKVDVGIKDLYRPPKVGTYRGTEAQETSAADAKVATTGGANAKPKQDDRVPKGEEFKGDKTGVKSIPMYFGEGVVLTTEAHTACVKVLLSTQDIAYGDWVILE